MSKPITDETKDKRHRHGLRQLPEYKVWAGMKTRCSNPRQRAYADYGGKGIKVCQRWIDSFDAFLQDVGRRPSPIHSLDRIDVRGDYCPENCRWATPHEQSRNTTQNRMITAFGKTQCLLDWSRETGIPRETIKNRMVRHGMSAEAALTPGDRRRTKNPLPPAEKEPVSWLDYSFM